MKLTYLIDYDTTIKEFIYKKISRNFYGYLKEHNVSYLVNGIAKKSYEEIRYSHSSVRGLHRYDGCSRVS